MATGGQETPRPGLEGNLVDVSPLYGDDIQLRSRRIPRSRKFNRKEKVDSEITLQHNYYNPISTTVVQDMTTTSDAEITSLKKKFSTTQKQIEDCSTTEDDTTLPLPANSSIARHRALQQQEEQARMAQELDRRNPGLDVGPTTDHSTQGKAVGFADHKPEEGEAPQRLKALMHPRASELSPWGSQELFLYCPDTHRYFQEAPDGKELVEVMIPPEEEPHFREIVGATPPEEGSSDASALSGNESTTNPPSDAEKSGQPLPPVDEVEETDPASTTDVEAEKAPLVLIRNQGQGSPNPVPFIQKSRTERDAWCRETAQLWAHIPTRPHRMITKAKKKGNYMPIWCPECKQEGRHNVHCEAAPEVPVGVIADNRTQCVYTYVVFADGDPVPNNGWDVNTHLYGEILITQCAPDLGAHWVLTQDELTHRFLLRDRAPISLDARPRTPWFSWIGFGVKVKCEKCQHSYGHEENCVWDDAPVFLEYHPTKANHLWESGGPLWKGEAPQRRPGTGNHHSLPLRVQTSPEKFKVVPLSPMEVTLKAIAPSDPAEGKSSPKGRYDGFGNIKKSAPQGNQAVKTLKPEGKSSQGGSGDPQPPIPFCDHCRATDCL